MKAKKLKRIFVDAILIMIVAWVMITVLAWVQTGVFPLTGITQEDLPILIGVYLGVGLICGFSLSIFLNLFRK